MKAVDGLQKVEQVEIPNRTGAVVLPRPCRYPPCSKLFTPIHLRYNESKFCCPEHKQLFWKLAAEVGEQALLGQGPKMAPPLEGRNHNEKVLNFLRSLRGEEIEDPALRFPGIVWHSRVADLRRKGFQIECRRAGSWGSWHYFYRLVE
jgi:hypothetical protein